MSCRRTLLLLALCLAAPLAGCLEERVIRDNTVDAKFSRAMGANGSIIHGGQTPTSIPPTSNWQMR